MSKSPSTGQIQSASTARSVPSPADLQKPHAPEPSVFLGAALGMSWQLAVVVIIPIVGGFKIDERTGSLPLFTLVGFATALLASVFVVKRALSELNRQASADTSSTIETSTTARNIGQDND